VVLLKKIEELTSYAIEQNKMILALEGKCKRIGKRTKIIFFKKASFLVKKSPGKIANHFIFCGRFHPAVDKKGSFCLL
jgi:hypothetical protein